MKESNKEWSIEEENKFKLMYNIDYLKTLSKEDLGNVINRVVYFIQYMHNELTRIKKYEQMELTYE